MFTSILNTATEGITLTQILICSLSSAVMGLIIALSYSFKSSYSKNFVSTLVILPVIVQGVIMVVNGNVGTGVAVVGAFSLVRFRSVPGTSKDIGSLFLAMAVGIATGMGQIAFAFLMVIIVCLLMLFLNLTKFGVAKKEKSILRITIPEDLDYNNVFDDILNKYTYSYSLVSAKTVNMGSLFDLRYEICINDINNTKAMIDELRCRNGNLTISCSRQLTMEDESL